MSTTSSLFSLGLAGPTLLSLSPIVVATGAFVMDYNETHVYNPNWPPHARFHNGQTMSMGVVLAAGALYYTWRAPLLNTTPATASSQARVKDHLLGAALWATVYGFTGLTAILYPGSKGVDPEFGEDTFPQKWVFGGAVVVAWVGYALALGNVKEKVL
ncbi:hypothetical protein BT63DRAFT_409602 [Microthyrium microscopicum]|uniref:Uncharacterized protein n=1 Tax=Microthyrium microscopicum TaxID=703497 RepID=A0A6A6UVL7_9PEZI|nr:hypothetical protein BT63DRAFT_409602 [Microthyrium microscopicum]